MSTKRKATAYARNHEATPPKRQRAENPDPRPFGYIPWSMEPAFRSDERHRNNCETLNNQHDDRIFGVEALFSYWHEFSVLNFEIISLDGSYQEDGREGPGAKDGPEGYAIRITSSTAEKEDWRKTFVIGCDKISHVLITREYHEGDLDCGSICALEPGDLEVAIVPKSCMGAGGLETRHHPEIISFRYPNMRANHELFGWEPPLTREDRFRRPPVETYLSVLKDRLGSIVQVTDLTFMTPRYHPASDNEFHCPASLMPVRGSHVKEKTTGIIYFVDAGIFFSSFTLPDDDERVTVLLPRPSIRSGNYTAILPADNLRTPSPIQELLRWQTGTVELNLNISRYRGVEAVMALKFADIEFSIFDLVRDYVRARGYALDEVVQTVDRAKRNPGSLVWADEV